MSETEHEHVDMFPGQHLEVEAHEPAHVEPEHHDEDMGAAHEPEEPDHAPEPDHKAAMDEVQQTHPDAEHEHLETASHIVTMPHVESGNRMFLGSGTTIAAAWRDALRRLRAGL